MNATTQLNAVRLTAAAAALMLSLGLVSAVSQSMHVERFGDGAQVVVLEPVTVTAQTTVAATEPATRIQ